ncbi:MAG TPA: hypothetical protein VK448_04400 [Dissulfurispiraceae bacterium]|nr:hypothetical protein [Dissulfurispiraceae bacterium]
MIKHGEETFTIGLPSVYSLTEIQGTVSQMSYAPSQPSSDAENPFVMGRSLLVLALVETIIGVGIYQYFF